MAAHLPQGAQSVFLDAFLGLVTNVDPSLIPEGASPLNWDVDFITGSVLTRPGLAPLYSAANLTPTQLTTQIKHTNFTGNAQADTSAAALACASGASLVFDTDNTLYINNTSGVVHRFSSAGALLSTVGTFGAPSISPHYTSLKDGGGFRILNHPTYGKYLVISDGAAWGLNLQAMALPSGTVTNIVGPILSGGGKSGGWDVDDAGNIWVFGHNGGVGNNATLYQITFTSATTIAQTGTTDFLALYGWISAASVRFEPLSGKLIVFGTNGSSVAIAARVDQANSFATLASTTTAPASQQIPLNIGADGYYIVPNGAGIAKIKAADFSTAQSQTLADYGLSGTVVNIWYNSPFNVAWLFYNSNQDALLDLGNPTSSGATALTDSKNPNGSTSVVAAGTTGSPDGSVFVTQYEGGGTAVGFIDFWGSTFGFPVDFNYVKSLVTSSGHIYTMALREDGNLFDVDISSNPSAPVTLNLLSSQILPGADMFSTSLDDAEYMCFSNGLNGTDIPRQWVPYPTSILTRVSQVGPGAPPVFQGTGTVSQASATITSWAGAGSVVTFQAVNNFVAGDLIKLSGFATSTFFNGQVFTVLSTGLSASQFEITFSQYSGGTDTGVATSQYGYPVASLSQPAAQSDPQDPQHFQALLWSSGPGSTSSGTTITVYYANATAGEPQDSSLVNAFAVGAVYVSVDGAPFGNGTWLVTSVGSGKPPGGDGVRWYFTYQVDGNQYQFYGGPDNATGQYQQTVATLVVQQPIPNLNIGDQITISGVGNDTRWNDTWTITSSNIGQYNITQTSMAAGTATYSWTWAGTATTPVLPKAGGLVTVIGTTNGNGIFNVADAVIATVSGGPNSGTFTITGFPTQTVGAANETGQAETAGTTFTFDPGASFVGPQTGSIPAAIFSAVNGHGYVTTAGTGTAGVIASGTRKAVCFFETNTGYKTACSAPITFTTGTNATYIVATNIPIGPSNVIRRWIAFTVAGQNGIPGPNFYTIDAPVTYTVNGQTFRYTPTYVDDNITTTAKFSFSDAVLLGGEEIDVQGNDLFSQIELGSSGWNIAYAGRMFYGLEQNKVLNFTNMSFDGGYLPNASGGAITPLGWGIDVSSNVVLGTSATITAFSITSNVVTITAANSFVAGMVVLVSGLTTGTYLNGSILTVVSATSTSFTASFTHADVGNTGDSGKATPYFSGGTLQTSSVFGNAYHIQNTTGQQQSALGMIYQNAYQDAYNVPIILSNTQYSVRVACSAPSGLTTGSLVVDLATSNAGLASGTPQAGYGIIYGQFQVAFSSMTSSPQIFSGTLLTSPFTTGVPASLVLRVWASGIGAGADVLIDRIEVFPTAEPLLTTNVRVSYVDNFEAFDAVTGNIGLAEHNNQTCYGAVVLHDQLYFLQSAAMQSTQDIPGVEPSGAGGGWAVHEVSNRVGTAGIYAYDYGEEWILTACRNGIFGFNGGQPIRLDFLQKELWESINWKYGYTIWLKNDLLNRRILCGVPLPTPNKWLPTAPTNANPTSPNVVFMINWQGLDDFQELVAAKAMHTTMFGNVVATDMRLKFSIWQITTPYAGHVTGLDGVTDEIEICGDNGLGKIYNLSATQLSDDGTAINSTYYTYGFVNSAKATQFPLLGFHRKNYTMAQVWVTGAGSSGMQLKAYPNFILNPSTLVFNSQGYTCPLNIPLSYQPVDDIIRPLNIAGNRVYIGVSTNAVDTAFQLSKLILVGSIHPYATVDPNAG